MADRPAIPARSVAWNHLAPTGVVLLAVAMRTWVALDEQILFDDAPRFLRAARLLLEGDLGSALTDAYHPLTAILIALTSWLSGLSLESAGVFVSVVSGGVATAALYALAREQFGRQVAIFSALLFAIHPQMVSIASNVQSDGIHVAFFLVGALLAWRTLEQGRFLNALGTGIVCGLAYLTRPEGLAVGVVLVGWLAADLLRRRISWRRFLRVVAGFSTALLAFGGPYLVAMHAISGSWILTQKKQLGLMLWNLPEPARLLAALSEIGVDGWRAIQGLYLLLALLALRSGLPGRRALYLLSYVALLVPVLVSVHLEAGYVSRRHWLIGVAALMSLAALGLQQVASALAAALPARRQNVWISPILGALLVGAGIAHALRPQTDPVKLARKEAALWLRPLAPQSVAAQRQRSAYYAGAPRHISLPSKPDLATLGGWLRDQGAEFLIAEQGVLPPQLPGTVSGLQEIHRVEYAGGSVPVLRVLGLPPVGAGSPGDR